MDQSASSTQIARDDYECSCRLAIHSPEVKSSKWARLEGRVKSRYSSVLGGCNILLGLCSPAQTGVWQPSAGHALIPVWPSTPPDAQPVRAPEIVEPSGTSFRVGGRQVIGVSNVIQSHAAQAKRIWSMGFAWLAGCVLSGARIPCLVQRRPTYCDAPITNLFNSSLGDPVLRLPSLIAAALVALPLSA